MKARASFVKKTLRMRLKNTNWQLWGGGLCVVTFLVSLLYLVVAGPGSNELNAFDPSLFKTADNTRFKVFTLPSGAEVRQLVGQSEQSDLRGYTGADADPLDVTTFKTFTRIEDGEEREYVKFFIEKPGYAKSEDLVIAVDDLRKGVWQKEPLRLIPDSKLTEARVLHPLAFYLLPISFFGAIAFLALANREVGSLKEREKLRGEAGKDAFLGTFVQDYLVKNFIGKGAQGPVYRVTKEVEGKLKSFALKVFENREPRKSDSKYDLGDGEIDEKTFNIDLEKYQNGRERFLREARVGLGEHHPNIGFAIESGDGGDFLWLVMPFYSGGNLKDELANGLPEPEKVLSYAKDITNGLEALHSKNIVHRDLKPENIMIDENGRLVIIDLGLSKSRGRDLTITQAGASMGTPIYAAPELIMAPEVAKASADQYTFACIVFEMLTGEPPLKDGQWGEMMQNKLVGNIRTLRHLDPNQSEEVEKVLSKMLSTTSEGRYASVTEAYEDFERAYSAWIQASPPVREG